MSTLGQRLEAYRGFGPGFDFLRIGLASSIVAFHCFLELGQTGIRSTPFWFVEDALVPMFFALSGFLVTGSALRLSLSNFLINRGLRIIPALAVDIALCALIIGPLFTTLPIAYYVSDSEFFKYFLNISGWIHYYLPGVFKNHPTPMVNGALWTVPYEMFCYVIMSFLMVTGWVKSYRLVLSTLAAVVVVSTAVKILDHHLPHNLASVLMFVFVDRGTRLLMAFLLGIAAYQLKAIIPYSAGLFLLCCVLCLIAAIGHDATAISRLLSHPTAMLFPLTYMTCFLGVTPIPVPKFVHTGDYSYGVYLYHDPLLQVIIAFFPSLIGSQVFGAVGLFALGLPAVGLLAAFSWHFVEKPILRLRRRFSFVAKIREVAGQGEDGVAPSVAAEDLQPNRSGVIAGVTPK